MTPTPRRLAALTSLTALALTSFTALALLVPACSAPPVGPAEPMPDGFAFTLWSRSADLRVTYFACDADGDLRFAGGQDAVMRRAEPVGRLTDEQRRRLWNLAASTGLLNATDQPFAQARRVQHRFEIKAGRWSRSFRTIDGEAPGAEAFHDAVFEMQSRMNDVRVPGF